MKSKCLELVKLLCENFESELKEAFRFCEGLKVPSVVKSEYEGKIVYPNMAKEFIAYLDTQGFFANQKCFILTDKRHNSQRLLYLTAVLNSKTNFWYFKQIGATLGASGYEMSKIFVQRLPVVEVEKIDSKLLAKIENLAQEILDSKDISATLQYDTHCHSEALGEESIHTESTTTQSTKKETQDTKALEQELDSLIYKAYGLDENEIGIIESEFASRERTEIIKNIYHLYSCFCESLQANGVLQKVDSLSYQGKIVWNRISSELCFSYDNRGCFILDSMFMINAANETFVRYLLGVLNSNISRHWIRQNAATLGEGIYGAKIYIEKLPIPKITESNQTLCDEIVALVDRILEVKAKDSDSDTKELESQIDNLVYKLYNVIDEEIQIIKGNND